MVLKSPPHTSRIKVLLELFPNARFVHIIRNPYVIFPSTVNLWKRLYQNQALQTPTFVGLEDYVFDTFNRMYDIFERDQGLIPPARLCEVRYEDLVKDPIGQMRGVYDQLQLGGFDDVLPALKKYFADKADYKTNRFQLSAEQRAEIARRWGPFLAVWLRRAAGLAARQALPAVFHEALPEYRWVAPIACLSGRRSRKRLSDYRLLLVPAAPR